MLTDAMNEMEKFEGELVVKRAGLQALRLNAADPSTLMQLKGVFNSVVLFYLVGMLGLICASTVFYHMSQVYWFIVLDGMARIDH